MPRRSKQPGGTEPGRIPKQYPILHALGGKNVYYFLAPLERGRLQTLPVAYDVRTRRPGFANAYFLLAEFYLKQGERSQAEAVLRQALQVESLSPQDRARASAALQKLTSPEPQ